MDELKKSSARREARLLREQQVLPGRGSHKPQKTFEEIVRLAFAKGIYDLDALQSINTIYTQCGYAAAIKALEKLK